MANFSINDDVDLYFEDELVGYGIIWNIDPNTHCHGIKLGEDRVAVHIRKCYHNIKLPFSHMDAEILEESLNTIALWSKKNLFCRQVLRINGPLYPIFQIFKCTQA